MSFCECRALSKQRTKASQLHQRLLRHTAAELGERPAAQRKAAAAAVRAFGNVYFTCQDFANSQHASQTLDNIMCLSVTKWVHLNQGDKGLKRLFAKVADALAPGGWFILEPQPWRSYKQARRKQVSAVATSICSCIWQLHSTVPCSTLASLQERVEFLTAFQTTQLWMCLANALQVCWTTCMKPAIMTYIQSSTHVLLRHEVLVDMAYSH